MKKTLAVIALALGMVALSGCTKQTTEVSSNYVLPNELADCKLFKLESSMSYIYVMRCPNSSTTTNYQVGKTRQSVTLIEESSQLPSVP